MGAPTAAAGHGVSPCPPNPIGTATIFIRISPHPSTHKLRLGDTAIGNHGCVIAPIGVGFIPADMCGCLWPSQADMRLDRPQLKWNHWEGSRMRINLASVFVDDQRKALAFYTDVLGFTMYRDIPLGEDSWLTVVSPASPDGPELLLEPSNHGVVKPFRDALVQDGIPSAQFAVDDVQVEYERLVTAGVSFIQEPTDVGPAVIAVFDDTCGNLIQIIAEKPIET